MLDSLTTEPSPNKPCLCEYIEGRCSFEQLDIALDIHANDSLEKQTAHKQFTIPPSLTVALMLEGDLDATLDGQPLGMSARHGVTGYLWLNRQPAKLERWLRAGQRIRKVAISLPAEHFSTLIGEQETGLTRWLTDYEPAFSLLQWMPSAHAIRHAEEILAAEMTDSVFDKLSYGIAALGLLRHALAQCHSNPKEIAVPRLNTRDAKRARQIREHILDHIHDNLSVDVLANQIGMSVSTLQRLFKNAYQMTVMEFVRTRRLELARLSLLEQGITVSEAAYQAGYSSPANFSTAFQREFGYTPSACVREGSNL
ncbi:AraC family transcriptional regulator [Candidatus Albibeggiatoa sp. nov. NOAA]|uniref:helix-turn-helix transcriptional regulator n=1 Tax=Candidatus Albibeggiatoa sp. nov. NOAA TaxID=3162724 RepID=UPI0032F2FA83|nr:AraC family transcriptional regulator [Thiotrichaceae bacterium]